MNKNRRPPIPSLSESASKKIPQPREVKKVEFSFSFRYFNQIPYFGLDTVQKNWFISLIERLKEFSKIDIEAIKTNNHNHIRYHPIDWEAQNIPISRSDCRWIDKEYLENEEEFPFVQFHVSKALGRIVGFWNEDDSLFYIVLLDPLHNIQPSKKYDYKVRDSHPLSCQYSSLLKKIESIKKKITNSPSNSDIFKLINELPSNFIETNAVIFFLDDSYLTALKSRLQNNSLSDIIELGLLADSSSES